MVADMEAMLGENSLACELSADSRTLWKLR